MDDHEAHNKQDYTVSRDSPRYDELLLADPPRKIGLCLTFR